MKKLNIFLFIILGCLITQYTYSQNIGDLKGIYYQAVAIDEEGKEIVGMDVEGKPLYEKAIGVRFAITKGLNGPVQWEETHTTNTDKYGLFSLTIGLGQQTGSGSYNRLLDIPWIDADQFLKVEIATKNDGNYKLVSNQQFMSTPYSFYTDDIADDAITTEKILDRTILSEDISEGAVTTFEILDGTILNEDVATGAIDSRAILDGTILAEDISEGAVTTFEILDGTIQNEDIADETIDLTSKVTGILPVANGGTGGVSLTDGGLLVGGGTDMVRALPQALDGQIPVGVTSSDPVLKTMVGGTGILVTQGVDEVVISSSITGGVEADGVKTLDIGVIPAGSTYISPSFPVPGDGTGQMGDIILASIDQNLRGCMLTPYFFSANTVKVAIFNGTGNQVNLGNNVQVKLLIVQ